MALKLATQLEMASICILGIRRKAENDMGSASDLLVIDFSNVLRRLLGRVCLISINKCGRGGGSVYLFKIEIGQESPKTR